MEGLSWMLSQVVRSGKWVWHWGRHASRTEGAGCQPS